jgi:two-component system NarL family sensor kinase
MALLDKFLLIPLFLGNKNLAGFQLQTLHDVIRFHGHVIAEAFDRWAIYLTIAGVIIISVYGYFRYLKNTYARKFQNLKNVTEYQQKLIRSELAILEQEKNRIAKELHDGVGTNLTAIKLTVNKLLEQHNDPLAQDVEEQFQVTLNEIKEIIYGLTPPGLERYGLFAGLSHYINRLNKNIPVNISLKTFGEELTIKKYELNIVLFRIIQELISVSIKHSSARNITIHISSFEDNLSLIYEDDGNYLRKNTGSRFSQLEYLESKIQAVNGVARFDTLHTGVSCAIDVPIHENNYCNIHRQV